jgi:hypothetical protein
MPWPVSPHVSRAQHQTQAQICINVKCEASQFDLAPLDAFLGSPRCRPGSLNAPFNSASMHKDPNMRYTLYERLLKAGAGGVEAQKALTAAVTELPLAL